MKELNLNTFIYLLIASLLTFQLSPCKGLGVCYGRNGNDLPSPKDVISLYIKCGIQFIRLYDPNPEVLEALQGSNLKVSLGVRNEDLSAIASSQTAAIAWVNANVVPYRHVSFSWITLGNEVIPGPYASFVPQAMKNIQASINQIGLTYTKVTTVVSMNILWASYPPSAGTFANESVGVMTDVVAFLSSTNAPLMLNVYPYFAYASDPAHISFEYAAFITGVPVIDGNLKYYSLFDAMVDAVNAALEKINAGNVAIVVSETGWPTAGNEPYTSIDKAQVYNQNMFNHVRRLGTPRRPNQITQTFIFAMFNENLKPVGVEQHWGLFYPNTKPVYPMFENCLA